MICKNSGFRTHYQEIYWTMCHSFLMLIPKELLLTQLVHEAEVGEEVEDIIIAELSILADLMAT